MRHATDPAMNQRARRSTPHGPRAAPGDGGWGPSAVQETGPRNQIGCRISGVLILLLTAALGDFRAEGAENARPKKIYAHYMGCFPAASGPIGYWWTQEHKTDHRSSDPVRAVGGRYRDWPLVPPGTKLTPEQSADLDICRAVRAGFDGFAIDAWAGHQAKEVLAALFKVAEEKDYPFEITICMDPNCHAAYTRGENPRGLITGYTESIKYLLDTHGSNPKLARRDGKPLIFGYHSRGLGRAMRPKDALADPANWDGLIDCYKHVEKNVGRPLFFHFCMGAFFYGCDLRKLPGSRPPHQPAVWMVKSSEKMAEYFPAIGAFIDRDFYPELGDMARVVRAKGAEWSQPLWHQYQNMTGSLMVESGTDKLRDRWQKARDTGSTLLQYVTWNDYGEATDTAPNTNARYTILDLNAYFIHWWKHGEPPVPDHDKVYLISRHYPAGVKTFPFRSQRFVDGKLEVLTILRSPATVRLPGRNVAYRAPAGLHWHQLPLTPGLVVAEVIRDGHVGVRLEHPEPISDRPYRGENIMDCFSTEFERHWRADFADAPPFVAAEYGDDDDDGLPNWFEMYWFGTFFDWSTATVARPDADPDGDGATNLQEYMAQTDPTTPPATYKVGDTWDMRGIYAKGVSFNPDPDWQETPVWHYLYKVGNPGVAHDGSYAPCPTCANKTPYTGPLAHFSPLKVEGFTNNYGWICRRKQEDASAVPHLQLVFRPRVQAMLVLAWESPTRGQATVRATVLPVEGTDGITLGIEHSNPQRELLREVYGVGEGGDVELTEIPVTPGDRLYLVSDSLPGGEGSTLVLDKLEIELTATSVPRGGGQ